MAIELSEGDTSAIVRELRTTSGTTQRELAELAGTSGPTIALYERGTKEPRLSTLQRLASSVGLRVEVRVVPADPGGERRRRRERRSLAIAAASAAAVARDYPTARRLAEANLDLAAAVVGDNAAKRWITEWRRVLDDGPEAVRRVLLDVSEHGHDMRQMAPFAGLLSDDERAAALAVVDALDDPVAAR